MTEIDNPSASVPGEHQLGSSVGGENVDAGSFTLSELNQTLGRTYSDKATALAALKETYRFIGQKATPASAQQTAEAAPTVPANVASKDEVQALRNDLFFSQNPEYKEYRDLITSMGAVPSEVVGTEAFKKVFEKVKVADEVSKQRSVVSSNPRLAQTTTKMEEAVKIANATNSAQSTADILAGAIIDELNLRQ